MNRIFKILSKKEIVSLSDEELSNERKKRLRLLLYLLIPAFIIIEAALWLDKNLLWKILLLTTFILVLPTVISTSKLSSEYFKRNKEKSD